jgi:hypothetical protein
MTDLRLHTPPQMQRWKVLLQEVSLSFQMGLHSPPEDRWPFVLGIILMVLLLLQRESKYCILQQKVLVSKGLNRSAKCGERCLPVVELHLR